MGPAQLLALLSIGTAAAAEPPLRVSSEVEQVEVHRDGRFVQSSSAGHHIGSLPLRPESIALDGRGGFVALGGLNVGDGPALAVVNRDGVLVAAPPLSELFDGRAREGFWAPRDGQVAWRVDWWVDADRGRLVVVPDAPAQPVAVSLADGLVENPEQALFLERLERRDLWFEARLRALELAATERSASLAYSLRRVVSEHGGPLVLRLRAAALLAQEGDAHGRSLVLLTSRSPSPSARAAHLDDEPDLVLPVPSRPCDQPPSPALHLPYDHRAARSYAIQLLPTFFNRDSVPMLRQLLAFGDDQDRSDARHALGCLVQAFPDQTDALLPRPRRKATVPTGQLAALPSPVGRSAQALRLLIALIPLMLLSGTAALTRWRGRPRDPPPSR